MSNLTVKYLIISLIILCFSTKNTTAQVSQLPVKQINWKKFNRQTPDNEVFNQVKIALLHANQYALTSWYHQERNYKTDSSGYLDLKSKSTGNENRYRFPAGMAFGLAISLKTAIYNAKLTGVSAAEAQAKTIKLLTAVAYDHKVNQTRKVWAGDWQAAHWAYYAGYAGWLLWDKLAVTDKQYVQQMIIFEAERLLNTPPLFYKDRNGKVLFPGDSKIEENAWNAELLYLGAVMMPQHPHSQKWLKQAVAYMIAATALPSDLNSKVVLNGFIIKDWLNGYNVEEPGIVINHDIIHPLYNALSSVVNAPIVFSLAGLRTPEAARHNMDKIYNSLINTRFEMPTYKAPGGTMYIKGKTAVYYPQGTDWGTDIYDSFANMDIASWMYGYDKGQEYGGQYWAKLHMNGILNQQNRFKDGHTYIDAKENSYAGREAAIATRMGSAWMTIWLQSQSPAVFDHHKIE